MFLRRSRLGIGRYRPDLIDTSSKQLYEIKTIREFTAGQAKLTLYLLILNWADPDKAHPWTRGTMANYSPSQRLVPLDTFGTYAAISPPILGVITYDITNLPATIATLATIAIRLAGANGAVLQGQVGVASISATAGGL